MAVGLWPHEHDFTAVAYTLHTQQKYSAAKKTQFEDNFIRVFTWVIHVFTWIIRVFTWIIHVFTSITGVETNDRLGLHMAVWMQAKVRERGLVLRARLYTGSVYDAQCVTAAVCGPLRYTSALLLPLQSCVVHSECGPLRVCDPCAYLSHVDLFINNPSCSVHKLVESRQSVFKTLHFFHAWIVDGRQQRRDLSRQWLAQINVVLTTHIIRSRS